MSGEVSAPAGAVAWPFVMGCADCEWPSARVYPYPMFEDKADFETDEFAGGRTTGTLWCPRCSPAWGEFLLQQMVLRSIALLPGVHHREPAVELLGGRVPEIDELEGILADFTDGPGPVIGPPDRPLAPRGDAFAWACADLVSWMRDARLVGTLYWRNGQWVPVPWWPTGAAA